MNRRIEKVGSQIKRLIGEYFAKYSSDLGINFVTIDDILISQDLGIAKIWVSFFGQADPIKEFRRIKRHSKEIQAYIYKNMRIKKVPKLDWQLSKDSDAAYRIDKILDDIKSNSPEHQRAERDSHE